MENKENKTNSRTFSNRLITYFGFLLLCIIIVYIIYLLEKYIFYTPIFWIIYILLKQLRLYKTLLINLSKYISIFLSFYIQLIFIRKCILSIVFMAGGLGKKIMFYNQFKSLLKKYIKMIENIINYYQGNLFDSSSNNLINTFITKIINLKKSLESKQNLFENFEYPFFNYLSNAIELINRNDIEKSEIVNNLTKLKENLSHYINYSIFEILFKFKYKEATYLLNSLLSFTFQNRNFYKIKLSNNFEINIISPQNNCENICKTLIIFCNQNAVTCESYSVSYDNLKDYLKIPTTTLLIWNYPGFGIRKGFPTFNKIDQDISLIVNYVNKEYRDYKIIIHGISIGGYSCIKIAKQLIKNDIINQNNICLIADRTYGDVDKIVEKIIIKYGWILKIVYNLLFPKFLFKSDNVYDYINIQLTNKFIFFDEKDTMIEYNPSSLIYNITLEYYKTFIYKKLITYKEYNNLIKAIKDKNLQIEIRKLHKNSLYLKNSFDTKTNLLLKFLYLYIGNEYLENKEEYNYNNFLMYFFIFGFPFNQYKELNYNKNYTESQYLKLPYTLKEIIQNNKSSFSVSLISFISKLNFLFVKLNLISTVSEEKIISFKFYKTNNDFSLKQEVKENLFQYFGCVHRIFCGHNGSLQINDINYLYSYLQQNYFIEVPNDTYINNKKTMN